MFWDAISVKRPTDLLRVHDVTFRWNRGAFDRLTPAFLSADRERHVVKATFVGLLETRPDLEQLVGPKDQPLGFGHLGAAPAQMLIKDIIDVAVEDKPVKRQEQLP
jgi:hypothetical protein